MDEFELLVDLHGGAARQGPGSEHATRQAIALCGLEGKTGLRIADIGCGSGASTLVLAKALDAQITAVDLFTAFLEQLEANARDAGVADRIDTLAASMDALPFADAQLDAIWSEGAIYNIGFEAGIRAWRPFLKPGGIIAASELTWLTHERPVALSQHWEREYDQVDTASAKIALLEKRGFQPIGYFPLSEECWLDNYYRPLQQRFSAFLERHRHSDTARQIIAAEQAEIALYERYRAYVSYGFYIARKVGE